MADTSVEITAGTGTNIDTRTESTNGNHRQVVVIGDPATNAGVAPVDATNGLAVDVKASVALAVTNAGITSIDGKVTACNTGAVTVAASALPTGASTAANQTTIIGHVDGIETVLGTIDGDTSSLAGCVGGTELQIDVVSSALPTGAATSAKQLADNHNVVVTSCAAHHVTNAGTFATQATLSAETTKVIGTVNVAAGQTIAVTNAGTFAVQADLGANNDVTVTSGAITETNSAAIKTAVEVIDNAIAGTEMQVDVVAALPAGTNAIGKLAANSGVDIGDVDVTSLPALAASIGNGSKNITTGGTAEALAGSTACKKVIICAKDTNTGKVFYGGASVSATSGAFLYPGASVVIDISNLSAVYLDVAVNGEGVQYTYVA